MSVNSRLQATKIIGQGKAFYRERIPEPSWAKKEIPESSIASRWIHAQCPVCYGLLGI